MARRKEQGGAQLRPDIAVAAARLGARLRDQKDLEPAAAYLGADETVLFVVLGTVERGGGVLVLTDARLVFWHRRITKPTLDLALGAIGSVTTSSGLSTGEVSLQVGADVVAISRIVKSDLEPLAEAIRHAIDVAPDVVTPIDAAVQVDPFEVMEKLAALRDSGVLTEAEFAAKKQQLLDRL